jgi:dUTP pyrophosphatase
VGLNIYRLRDNTNLPKHQTMQSACFDLTLNLEAVEKVDAFNDYNINQPLSITGGVLNIPPRFRVMVPLGIILDIPVGYSVRIHPRSSVAYKRGIVLANQEAVIDSDYVEELQLLLYNMSSATVILSNNERIAQGEMVKSYDFPIEEIGTRPLRKGNRVGGVGSTGSK